MKRVQFIGRCIAPPITLPMLENCARMALPDVLMQASVHRLTAIVCEHRLGRAIAEMPDPEERRYIGAAFDGLAEPERTTAFHLLWAVNEIALGRSPRYE